MSAFAPEVITHIGSFPITNTILSTLLVDGIIVGGIFALKKSLNKIPNAFQNIIEMTLETFYGLIETVAGKNTQIIFPFVMSFFLFILVANWSGLIPGLNTVGFFLGQP